jgi:hypothetical protein
VETVEIFKTSKPRVTFELIVIQERNERLTQPSSPGSEETIGRQGSQRQTFASRVWSRSSGLIGYSALLAGGTTSFLIVRSLGERLDAPVIPADARPVGRSTPGQVDVALHVTATLAAVIGLGFGLGRLLKYLGQPS